MSPTSDRSPRLSFGLLLPFLVLIAGCNTGTDQDSPDAGGAWTWPNRDSSNTRAADSSIDSTNVDQLGEAWSFPIPGTGAYGSAASNPLIDDDTVYFQDLASNVFALDFETGDVRWEKRYDVPVVGPNGPGLGDGKLVFHSGASSIAALDPETGEELWEAEMDHATGAQQPVVWNGHVYTGTAAGEVIEDAGSGELGLRGYAGGASGFVYALDAETGETAWRFQVVEEDFWGNPEVNSGGGIWYPPAIDEERGLTYWGTGNPAPFPGTVDFPNAESRPGRNLYTNSILALEADTGELSWYQQVKPFDLFDLDFQTPRVLASVEIDGEVRDIVIGAGKLGRVIAFDRDDGTILWDTSVGRHQNDELRSVPDGETITVFPGVYGGVETPMAYADDTIYAPVVNLSAEYDATAFGATTGTEAVVNVESRIDLPSGTGEVVAIDASTGQVDWSTDIDAPLFAGATVVNDLVFVADYTGAIYALTREDGEIVWTYQAPAGINAWPAIADDTIIWPAGAGGSPQLIALRLNASSSPTASPTTTSPTGSPTEASPTASATDTGAAATETEVTARNNEFDTDVIEATAGDSVEIRFRNEDTVPHNMAFYEDETATDPIYVGETITGPDEEVTYRFDAPAEPGMYFFRCDVHPTQMTGDFVVQ